MSNLHTYVYTTDSILARMEHGEDVSRYERVLFTGERDGLMCLNMDPRSFIVIADAIHYAREHPDITASQRETFEVFERALMDSFGLVRDDKHD